MNGMFSVYCEGHGREILLGPDYIEHVINHDHAIEVQWRCDQGHTGNWLIERRRSLASA